MRLYNESKMVGRRCPGFNRVIENQLEKVACEKGRQRRGACYADYRSRRVQKNQKEFEGRCV